MIEFINILLVSTFLLCSCITAYLFLLAIAARFYKVNRPSEVNRNLQIAILIPAYKEDIVICSTVQHCLQQNYPGNNFKVFVGAHFLQEETTHKLKEMGATVFELSEKTGSKALSLQHIFRHIEKGQFEIALILDADNILSEDCLKDINQVYQSGKKGIQLHRTAKNTNTPVALLDAISEEVNNTLFRKGNRALGLSSSTIGSGMAFEFESLRSTYEKPGIIFNPACDREVEFDQLDNKVKIEYLDDAQVLDEKVQNFNTYRTQRTRWNESQLWHIKRYIVGIRLKNITIDHLNKFIQNLIPSRILLSLFISLVSIIAVILFYFSKITIAPGVIYWIVLFGIYHITILISIPLHFWNKKLLGVFIYIPILAWNYIIAVTRIRRGRKEFIHTPKNFR